MREGTGKHRSRGVGGRTDTAFVKDRSISFNIEERLYRERGAMLERLEASFAARQAPARAPAPWACAS